MVNRKTLSVISLLAMLAGIGLTLLFASVWGVPGAEHSAKTAGGTGESDTAGHQHDHNEESGTYYTCPMHPSVVQDQPGDCPICGMSLVKKSGGGGGDASPQELAAIGRVALSPTQRVLANVETTAARAVDADQPGEKAKSGAAPAPDHRSEIRAVGIVAYDENGLASIPSWVDGRIDRLMIKETGAVVKRGEPVMKIYSEQLLTAQEEYLVALESSDKTLAGASRKRLELLGMRSGQIERVRETHKAEETVTAFAPNAGTITALKVRQGQYVKEGAPLYDIADLSKVWINADIHEENLRDIHKGMNVRVMADAYPGQSLAGEVTFIHPVLDPDTRTVKVRVELDNSQRKLKPGMYASVFFKHVVEPRPPATSDKPAKSAQPSTPAVIVPKSAVIRGGKANSIYVEVKDGVFERRQVDVGRGTGDFLTIRSGLKAGEEVAYRGGFLLDSEVQLNSFGGSGGGHDHMNMPGMDMPKDQKGE